MKIIITIILTILISSNAFAFQINKIVEFTKSVDEFLAKNVVNGRVKYKSIKETQHRELRNLLTQIEKTKIEGKSNYNKSFYINSYNILVINKIVELYPISSPLKHDGFFDKDKYHVAGEELTLNDLENKKIRAVYNDPRIHFAVVCAAKGCPKLRHYVYNPLTLDNQLDIVTRENMNSGYFIRSYPTMVEISKIFSWYKEDFGGTKSNFIDYINKYRTTKISHSVEVSFYEYDWELNEYTNE